MPQCSKVVKCAGLFLQCSSKFADTPIRSTFPFAFILICFCFSIYDFDLFICLFVNVIQNKPQVSQGNDLHVPCLAPVISLILQQV